MRNRLKLFQLTIFNSLTLKVKYIDNAFTYFNFIYYNVSYIEEKKRRGDKLPDLRHGIACIFQQKKKDDANNDHDRPIHVSLLSNFNKMFLKVIFSRMTCSIEEFG